MQAAVYKEDFERERRDRERAADFLEEKVEKIIESQHKKEVKQKRRIDLLLTTKAEQKQKLLAEKFQSEIDEETKKLEKALEEIRMRCSQVKQPLQRDPKEAVECAEHYKPLAKSLDQEESVRVCTITTYVYM